MLHPTIDELTQGKYNRYELALATAKCARLITDEYVRQHDAAERAQTGNKETDRPINTLIDRELRDEKAVKVAINRLYMGDYAIDEHADEYPQTTDGEETLEAEAPIAEDIALEDEEEEPLEDEDSGTEEEAAEEEDSLSDAE